MALVNNYWPNKITCCKFV